MIKKTGIIIHTITLILYCILLLLYCSIINNNTLEENLFEHNTNEDVMQLVLNLLMMTQSQIQVKRLLIHICEITKLESDHF